jgi:hypothetical protein
MKNGRRRKSWFPHYVCGGEGGRLAQRPNLPNFQPSELHHFHNKLWNHRKCCPTILNLFIKPPSQRRWSRGSSVGTATALRAGRPSSRYSSLSRGTIFLFCTSRSAVGSTQPPIQGVSSALFPGVKLATQLQLMPRSKKHGSIHPLPHTSSWRSA